MVFRDLDFFNVRWEMASWLSRCWGCRSTFPITNAGCKDWVWAQKRMAIRNNQHGTQFNFWECSGHWLRSVSFACTPFSWVDCVMLGCVRCGKVLYRYRFAKSYIKVCIWQIQFSCYIVTGPNSWSHVSDLNFWLCQSSPWEITPAAILVQAVTRTADKPLWPSDLWHHIL